jgi:hypothetical protein
MQVMRMVRSLFTSIIIAFPTMKKRSKEDEVVMAGLLGALRNPDLVFGLPVLLALF